MSEKETEVAAVESSETEAAPASFLDRAIAATKQTAPDTTKDLLATLTQEALSGTVRWSKNLTKTIEDAIAGLDEKMSIQMTEILHQPDFQKLEGSWRGLSKLIHNSELGTDLKVRMLDMTRDELLEQFEDASAIDRSRFFNIVYQGEFGTAGGEPFGLLMGDYAFDQSEESVALLRYVSSVAAAAHAPFIAELDPKILGYSSFEALNEGRPVAAGFESPTYNSWNAFRDSDDSRYVVLTMPKTLARLPYGAASRSVKGFNYEEFQASSDGERRPSSMDDLVWSSAAYAVCLLINNSFSKFGWCTAIRGLENGGKVENLPNYIYTSEAGDKVQQCPAQVNLTDEREKELSDLGFLPLVHYKNADFAVFMGSQTLQRPKVYLDPASTANAAISARLPYMMASSRIAHYLKVMGRDQIGSAKEPSDVQKHLSAWIGEYVNPNAVGDIARAEAPLREAQITVEEQAGRPGCYSAVAYLRPWLQMEELTTSLRMVANIPGGGGGGGG